VAFASIRTAIQNGATFLNGGEFYGKPEYNSLVLLNRYFTKYPEDASKVCLSIKGAIDVQTLRPDSSPEGLRRSLDNCIRMLGGVKKIDVFEAARRDPKVPLAEVFGLLQKEYIDTGKLGGIALSEVSAATIHDAVKIAKIVAVEVEFSLWSTDPLTNGVAAACHQYGIPLVAYSPVGRGVWCSPSSTSSTSIY
jgi:pyridoxine 4-dehydrogenase